MDNIKEGEKEAVLPNIGYNFASEPIEHFSFVEKNTEQEITYEVVEAGENNDKFQEVSVLP